ncbi:lysylphosphatidylglycerol synthetase-like protein (DUF2156 family) [Actinophytocola algeriensis]|uniref:Lysylphosphatidylglycerol synthetase-like protein (DUF2156 family) n=1 Tax=Actinophytocola algeriensis TaxID=1768010 RepID=A0A7W7VIL5_9PSEU|nr:lysylphosphatidylglycerol synthetase-like protein (DUF2156 family) [Actinophytocola algeriensis]MBE1479114.1 lysylphosphatidylglycerol synthetase-like protein (DUF2156 family) [Actinophytocola algeriensis]
MADHPLGDQIAYGVPAFQDGRWWSVLTGAPFSITPLCYVAVLASFAAFTGFLEHRLGTARAALTWAIGHVAGIVGAIALIDITGSALVSALDVGPSGGAMAAAAVATATLTPKWRLWTRFGLIAYVVGSLLLIGHLADVVHLVAVAVALPLGPLFVRRTEKVTASDRAVDLLETHGGGTLSWMTTWPGTEYLYGEDGYVAYRRHAGVAIAVGDPVGSTDWQRTAPTAFAAHCEREGLVPAWFSVTAATADAVGAKRVQVAEDTIVDLPGLEFRGKKWQDIRTARNRAGKDGITFRMVTLADESPAIIRQVREVSAGWLRGKRTPELGFTLGGVTEAMDPRVRVGIAVDADGTVHGVTSWLPIMDDADDGGTGEPRGWTLDMMRRKADGFRPVIEFLIAEACMTFQSEGARLVSLSGAPLVRTGDHKATVVKRALDATGKLMEPLYGFGSLHAFKAKFQPRREPLYLAYRGTGDLPRIGAAVLRAYLAKPTAAPRRPVPSVRRHPAPAPGPRRAVAGRTRTTALPTGTWTAGRPLSAGLWSAGGRAGTPVAPLPSARTGSGSPAPARAGR